VPSVGKHSREPASSSGGSASLPITRRWLELFLAMFLPLLFTGCREPAVWTSECRSQDGRWIATAQTVEYGGFGTGAAETTVEIRRSNGSGSPQRVLAFADGGREIGLKMHWEGSSHLVIVYAANPALLYFQVVKTSGIDISVQNVSPNPSHDFHPSARP
jgi:hypothetical protein